MQAAIEDMPGYSSIMNENKAPVIHLKGDDLVTMKQLDAFWDKGVTVEDDIDGYIMDVKSSVHICSMNGFQMLLKGEVNITDILCPEEYIQGVHTENPTKDNELFVIAYNARDSLGKPAKTRYRGVVVEPLCPPPEFWCHDNEHCSTYQVGVKCTGPNKTKPYKQSGAHERPNFPNADRKPQTCIFSSSTKTCNI